MGAAAAFSRRMYFDGADKVGCVLGDFCIDNRFRSLGPALMLQRACLEAVDGKPFEFCYDFPSSGMMAVYRRLGIRQRGSLVRFAKRFRMEGKIEKVVRSRTLAWTLAKPVNLVMAWSRRHSSKNTSELGLHSGLCGEEFTALDRQTRARRSISTARTAAYLNWRYRSHPSETHEILTARVARELAGYAVFTQNGENASIVDLCARDESSVVEDLLSGVTDILRRRGISTASMPAWEQHPWRAAFESLGFHPRESTPVITHACPGKAVQLANWHLMQGERDS